MLFPSQIHNTCLNFIIDVCCLSCTSQNFQYKPNAECGQNISNNKGRQRLIVETGVRCSGCWFYKLVRYVTLYTLYVFSNWQFDLLCFQAWCMLLNDKVLFRMQWPQYADLQVNGMRVILTAWP